MVLCVVLPAKGLGAVGADVFGTNEAIKFIVEKEKGVRKRFVALRIGIVSICANTPPCQDRFALSIRAPFTM